MEELNLKNVTVAEQTNCQENSGFLPDPVPEPTPITKKNRKTTMDAKSLRWCCGGASLLIVIGIIVVGVFLGLAGPADDSNNSAGADPVPWMSIPKKAIFKITLVLTSSSDTSRKSGGWIEAFSSGRSCKTPRFDFKPGAATEIFMEDRDLIDSHNKHPDGCNAFKMDTNDTMLIKVNKETGADIVIYQVKVTLEDGREYDAFFRPQQNETFAESFPLRIQTKARKLAMYLHYKQVKPNTRNVEYINQTKVDLKLNGNDHISCHTNPLPWPANEGTTVLQDLKFLGTCY